MTDDDGREPLDSRASRYGAVAMTDKAARARNRAVRHRQVAVRHRSLEKTDE